MRHDRRRRDNDCTPVPGRDFQLAHCVAKQVASLCRVRAVTLSAVLKTVCENSKGRVRGGRLSAGNQRLLGMMTWTLLVGDPDGSMQHQEQQQRLALATSTSVLADINVLCVASELHESTRALASASPSHAAPRQRSCGIDGRTCIPCDQTRLQ